MIPLLKLAVVLALVLAGCSSSASPSTAPNSTGSSRPSPVVDDRRFGELVAVDGNAESITLDLGQLFGPGGPEEANAAAREDGVIGPDEELPNPFYVRDLHERRTMALDRAATIVVLGHDADGNSVPTPITASEFASLWRTGPSSGAWTPADYYWCSLSGGKVVAMEAVHGP
jgi:hypothetical protein